MITRPRWSSIEQGLPPRRQWTLLAAVAIVALALIVGLPWLGRALAPKPPPPAPAPPPGTFAATDEQWATLKFAQVRGADFRTQVETDGKIAQDDDLTTQVFSPYSGRVTRVLVKAGDHVKRGQPLFEVQAAEFVQGQSDLAAAAAQEKVAAANEARLHGVYESGGGSLKDWQQSQSDLATAQAALQAARGRLGILGKSDAEIDALEHGASASGAATAVPSPITGVVVQRLIGVGQNIGSVTNGGANPAFVVSDLSKIWLVANVREDDSALIQRGQPVSVRVLALPGRTFQASIDYVAPTVDPVTHRLTVRAVIDNPGGLLKPEMFAVFDLAAGPRQAGVTVPEDAVVFEGDTARVWVARPAGKTLELRQIKAGPVRDGQVEVLSGLKPGEWIVTSGSLFIDRAAQPD